MPARFTVATGECTVPFAAEQPASPEVVAQNLRRLMARLQMTYDEVVEATGLDKRTVRGIASGRQRPHAHTLHRLAEGLGVPTGELFVQSQYLRAAEFDEATNPVVAEVIRRYPRLFADWQPHEFEELHSRFGVGGQLTPEGAVAAAKAMNRKREIVQKVRLLLETSSGDLLSDFVEMLYRRHQPSADDTQTSSS